MDPSAVLVEVLADIDIDESILEYMASTLEELTDEERRSSSTIEEMISPFLIELSHLVWRQSIISLFLVLECCQ